VLLARQLLYRYDFTSLRRLVWRLVRLCLGWLCASVFFAYGHVRRPPSGGSAAVNMMSGSISPSTTAQAPASAASL
jgi:hypothetical protein